MVRLMNTKEAHGNLTLVTGRNGQQEKSGPLERVRSSSKECDTADESPISGEVLLKTLEEPFESAGRSRRIARLRERILAGTYHIPALELAERMIDGDNF